MRTSVTIPTLLLTLVAACEPESSPDFERPDFDRIEFVAADDDTTDEGDAEETGDAGMGGVDELPDVGVPEPAAEALCCVCSTMQCFAWEDGEAACEAGFSEPAAWCELDVFGGATECAAACS